MSCEKLAFSVLQVSGEDRKYPAFNLNHHGPIVEGWRSARKCRYPQEVIVELKQRSRLHRIQLLMHPYLIASRVDIYCADDATNRQAKTLGFKKLGSTTFSDNSKTNFKARELKSFSVNSEARLLKFTLHHNHSNEYNEQNQVGIVAINVIGNPISSWSSSDDDSEDEENVVESHPFTSDLQFTMYQDPEIAEAIMSLERRRAKYNREHKVEESRNLKSAIDKLQKAGLILGKQGIEKQKAMDEGNTKLAEKKDQQMEDYRMDVYKNLHHVLRLCLPGAKSRYAEQRNKAATTHQPSTLQQIECEDSEEDELTFEERKTPEIPEPDPVTTVVPTTQNVTSYDDMVLPALKNKSSNQQTSSAYELENGAPVDNDETDDAKKTSKLTKAEKEQASLPIDVFGIQTVEKAYSKAFKSRERAIADMKAYLKLYDASKSKDTVSTTTRAALFLIHKLCKDKVLSVFNANTDLVTYMFQEFIPKHKLQRGDLGLVVDKIVPELLHRLGDTAPRIRAASGDYLLRLWSFHCVKPLKTVPQHILKPFKNNSVPLKLATSRCQLADKLVRKELTEESQYVTVRQVMEFCVKALDHSSVEVREIAEAIALFVYENKGQEVRPCLPPDNEQTRRKPVYKRLFEKFDGLDKEEDAELQDRQHEILALRKELEKVTNMRKLKSTSASSTRSFATNDNSSRMDLREGALSRINSSKNKEPASDELIENIDFERTCIFCGQRDEDFTTQGLDLHYFKSCPMLMCCTECNQVVEVSGLSEHRLKECDKKEDYRQCNRCAEAITTKKYNLHAKLKTCPVVKKRDGYCPLCHQTFTASEEAWKKHLMEPTECAFNSRRQTNPLNKK